MPISGCSTSTAVVWATIQVRSSTDNGVPHRGDENMVAYWNGRSGMKASYPRDTFAFAAYGAGRAEPADDRVAGNLMPPFEIGLTA